MAWEMRIGPRGGDGPWRGNFPLDRGLPSDLALDCSALTLPIHPMFAVRTQTFLEWHRMLGRTVQVLRPEDRATSRVFEQLGIGSPEPAEAAEDTVVPATRLKDENGVEAVSAATKQILEYQLMDVSRLGDAAFYAVSELCGNALEHGRNGLGAFVAARRETRPRRRVIVAIGDLGIGIPEHLRRVYPELSEDGYAIARAIEPGVSGTDDPHRGYGYDWVFEKALTSASHMARLEIHSLRGFYATEIVQEKRSPKGFPAANYKRGTWISLELVSV
jgi:hypothetical protein